MEKIYGFFDNNPWFNFVSLAIGVFGIFYSLYLTKKYAKEKRPCFNLRTIRILSTPNQIKENKIEIKYNGNPIKTLHLGTLSFWNDGKETIRKDDAIISSPLRLILPNDAMIFDFEIIESRKENNFVINQLENNILSLDFDFLDYNDGVIINFFHTPAKANDIQFKGSFIGAKSIQLGNVKNKYVNLLDRILKPFNDLADKNSIFYRIIQIILLVPLIILMIPLFLIFVPINFIYNKSLSTPQKYFLDN